jgi:hypothetical protein
LVARLKGALQPALCVVSAHASRMSKVFVRISNLRPHRWRKIGSLVLPHSRGEC